MEKKRAVMFISGEIKTDPHFKNISKHLCQKWHTVNRTENHVITLLIHVSPFFGNANIPRDVWSVGFEIMQDYVDAGA